MNQEITMDPFFTPIQALELQAGYYGVPKSDRRSMEILAAVGLDDKKDAYVRQLSGGMKTPFDGRESLGPQSTCSDLG